MRKLVRFLVLISLMLAVSTIANAGSDGFGFVVSREVRTVQASSQIRLDQYNQESRQPFGYLLGDTGSAYIVANGSSAVFSVDIALVQPGELGCVKWSTSAQPNCLCQMHDANVSCKGISACLGPKDYSLGSNALYFWEEIKRGRQTIFRLIEIIPIGRRSNTTTRNEFVQFGVEECEIPLNQRDDVNMGAWLQRVSAGSRPVYSGQALDLLQKSQQEATTAAVMTQVNAALDNFRRQMASQKPPADPPDDPPAKTSNHRLTVINYRKAACVLHIVDQDGGRDRTWTIGAGKTMVFNTTVAGKDSLTYYIVGHNDAPVTSAQTEITEEVR